MQKDTKLVWKNLKKCLLPSNWYSTLLSYLEECCKQQDEEHSSSESEDTNSDGDSEDRTTNSSDETLAHTRRLLESLSKHKNYFTLSSEKKIAVLLTLCEQLLCSELFRYGLESFPFTTSV
jgi:hypothetical protein